MRTRKPELRDFGITPEEYVLYHGKGNDPVWPFKLAAILSVPVFVGFVVTQDTGFVATKEILFLDDGFSVGDIFPGAINGLFVGSLIFGATFAVASFVIGIPATLAHWAMARFKRSRLLASPVAIAIRTYEEAEVDYRAKEAEAEKALREAESARLEAQRARWETESERQEAERAERRKLREYWMSLSGTEFERELGALYRARGYHVRSTPRTGDEGIDLVMEKDGETTVVQCKSHQKPAGPAVARELFGAMVAVGADNAILACTGGFTRGVKDFVRGKPIALISASTLAMAPRGLLPKRVAGETIRAPICPEPGCGKHMIIRAGRRGKFWGCPRYPRCSGTRQAT